MKRKIVLSVAIWALAISLFLHGTVGVVLQHTQPPQNRRPHGGGSNKESGEGDKPGGNSSIKMKIGPYRGADGQIIPLGPGKNGKPCYEWFGGLGFTHDGFATITEVYPGYPAQRMGLRPGDYIIDIEKIMGDPGSTVTFQYIRDGQTITATTKRERICTER